MNFCAYDFSLAIAHLSKRKSDLQQKYTQLLTPFSSAVFHALSHGVCDPFGLIQILDLNEVAFLRLKIDKYTLFPIFNFSRLVQYLLQFFTYKNLPYTDLTEI